MNFSDLAHIINSINKDLKKFKADGFRLVEAGRIGTIYFIENGLVVPIMTEMSGSPEYDILVSGELEFISNRFDIKNSTVETLSRKERKRIQKLLIEWLSKKKIRHNVYSEEWRPDFE